MKRILITLGSAILVVSFPVGGSASEGTIRADKLVPPGVATDFPYETRFVDVGDQKVAYVTSGNGVPVLFIHGNPTSSYLWRNILSQVDDTARAVALDLPGMGRSTKPRTALRFVEQVGVFEAFVEQLGLKDIVLVGHDWGATIAFEYARLHPANVRGIAFMEGVLPPVFPMPGYDVMGEELGGMFRALKDPREGRELVIEQNMFVEKVLPEFVARPMGDADLDPYRQPFLNPEDREAVLMWPRELPIAGEPADVVERLNAIRTFMETTSVPILLLYADPGVVVPPSLVPWYTDTLHDLEAVFVGPGLHYIQEDQPLAIGRALRDWLRRRCGRKPARQDPGPR